MDFSYPTRPLNAFAKLLSGGTPSKAKQEFWNGDIPWITPKDMGDWNGSTANHVTPDAVGNGTRLAPAWTSYIAVRGMSLHKEIRVVRAPFPATFNQDIKAVEAFDGVDNRFLYYCLVAHKPTLLEKVESAGHGTGRLPTDQLESLQIPDVDDNISVSIAKVLGNLDDKIILLREMNTTLEGIARAVFRAWFIDFEPVRAKAVGATSFRGMPQNLFETLPDSFTPSELGDIPTGWTVKSLNELVSQPVKRGLAPKYTKTGGVVVLNQKCVRNWEVNLELGRRHDAEAKPLKDKSVDRFDILVNSTGVGTLGRVAQVYHLNEETTVDSHLSLVKPNPQKIAPIFLGINLTEREEEIERLGHGSTGQTELSRHKLGELGMLVPKEEFQSAFEDIALPLIERKTSNTHEASVLSSMRDTLLPKLISGELETPSLEALGLEGGD
ncbi:restriction endonuclease subunit S [Pseudooceanicola sp. LIPI14-2-Ac024]|uniref:restriction endonuclease subunit S n=1 Tax=Pseudooceanicola sp. LIPI14-2-Ac024 TaxID=3344875 RepID=UPI0035CF22D7